MDKLKMAEQFFRNAQMFAQTLDEKGALEVACMYDPWRPGVEYKVGEYITHGVNGVGDPQLYKVLQGHVSQADWRPDVSVSLFSPVGLNESGYPVWSKPTGSHDAYNSGDIVDYNGSMYRSNIDGNVYSPVEYPAGWSAVEV